HRRRYAVPFWPFDAPIRALVTARTRLLRCTRTGYLNGLADVAACGGEQQRRASVQTAGRSFGSATLATSSTPLQSRSVVALRGSRSLRFIPAVSRIAVWAGQAFSGC